MELKAAMGLQDSNGGVHGKADGLPKQLFRVENHTVTSYYLYWVSQGHFIKSCKINTVDRILHKNTNSNLFRKSDVLLPLLGECATLWAVGPTAFFHTEEWWEGA